MKIFTRVLACPKCKKEKYFRGEEALKKHPCENCGIEMVDSHHLDQFDESGNYSPKLIKVDSGTDLFDLYTKILDVIVTFFNVVDGDKVILRPYIKRDERELNKELSGEGIVAYQQSEHAPKTWTGLFVIGEHDDKKYLLLHAPINEYTISIGDRRNAFMDMNLVSSSNLIVSNIYEYMTTESCSRLKRSSNNDRASKISCELLETTNPFLK